MPDRQKIFAALRAGKPPAKAPIAPLPQAKIAFPETPSDRIALFKANAEKVQAIVLEARSLPMVPQIISSYLAGLEIDHPHMMAPNVFNLLEDWQPLTPTPWQDHLDTKVGISLAQYGVVETGSLLLASSPENPMSVCFLAEHHIVLLPLSKLVNSLNDSLQTTKTDDIPRTISYITGPSRTGDIESTFAMGIHGPASLGIILYEDES